MDKNKLGKSVFSGLFWKFGERFFAQGASFLVSLVLARLLMPSDYGVISLVMVFISLAEVFVVSGFSTALIQKRDATPTEFSTMFYCSFVVSVVIYLVIFLAAPALAVFYEEPLLCNVLRVLGLRLPLGTYNSIQTAYVSRHMLFKRSFFSNLIGTIVSGLAGIAMALAGAGIWALVTQYLTYTVINTVVLALTVPWHLELRFSRSSVRPLMSYGWKVLAADLIGNFCEKLRTLIIGRVYSTADLAFYDKGQQLPDLITSNISSSVMSVLFPAIANTSDDIQSVKYMTKRAFGVMAYVIFPMMAGMIAVAEPLIDLLYTEKWAASVPYLQLLCISSAVGLVSTTALQSVKAIGRSDVLLRIEMIKKPVYLVILLLSVRISVMAVAVGVVAYGFYSSFINARQLRTLLNYPLSEQLRDLRAPFLLSVTMGVSVFLVGKWLPLPSVALLAVQVVTGVAVYAVLSFVCKVPEFLFLRQIVMGFLGKKKPEAN